MSRQFLTPGLFSALAAALLAGCATAPVAEPPRPLPDSPAGLRAAAESGDPRAQTALAEALITANGLPRNPEEGASWNEKAARQGHVPAMVNLGWQHSTGTGVAQDFALARRWFDAAAEGSGPVGHYEIAQMYASGRGVGGVDDEAAVRHLQLAANARHPAAMAQLGRSYFLGTGVTRDHAQAIRWLQSAATAGQAGAQSLLGRIHLEGIGTAANPALARRWLGAAAGQGDREAQKFLGWIHENGLGGPRNFSLARTWYERAAQQGELDAMSNLGGLHLTGEGGKKDLAEALRWIRPAARAGHARALVKLGLMYEEGEGLAADPVAALLCYENAAAQGDEYGMYHLGMMYAAGDGVDRNLPLAAEWLGQAAARQHPGAAAELAKLRATPAR